MKRRNHHISQFRIVLVIHEQQNYKENHKTIMKEHQMLVVNPKCRITKDYLLIV